MADSNFYLGRAYDPIRQTITEKEIRYDPADLTTHAVVTGMTGSGKTGLCVVLLEEAALQGIPAIIIDPKGDLTNLLLHFPDLAPQDFQPWIDADLARRAGKGVEQVAADASLSWREGLKEWGIPQERILALKNAAQFAIFTPGSDAGIPASEPGVKMANWAAFFSARIRSCGMPHSFNPSRQEREASAATCSTALPARRARSASIQG